MRTEFPNPVKRAALDRSGGICECHRIEGVPGLVPGGCGAPIGPGNTWFEHVAPDGAGGAATLENCAVLTKTCGRIKSAKFDQPKVAKVKRQRDKDRGIRTGRAARSRPMDGSRRSPWVKRVDGTTERRM